MMPNNHEHATDRPKYQETSVKSVHRKKHPVYTNLRKGAKKGKEQEKNNSNLIQDKRDKAMEETVDEKIPIETLIVKRKRVTKLADIPTLDSWELLYDLNILPEQWKNDTEEQDSVASGESAVATFNMLDSTKYSVNGLKSKESWPFDESKKQCNNNNFEQKFNIKKPCVPSTTSEEFLRCLLLYPKGFNNDSISSCSSVLSKEKSQMYVTKLDPDDLTNHSQDRKFTITNSNIIHKGDKESGSVKHSMIQPNLITISDENILNKTEQFNKTLILSEKSSKLHLLELAADNLKLPQESQIINENENIKERADKKLITDSHLKIELNFVPLTNNALQNSGSRSSIELKEFKHSPLIVSNCLENSDFSVSLDCFETSGSAENSKNTELPDYLDASGLKTSSYSEASSCSGASSNSDASGCLNIPVYLEGSGHLKTSDQLTTLRSLEGNNGDVTNALNNVKTVSWYLESNIDRKYTQDQLNYGAIFESNDERNDDQNKINFNAFKTWMERPRPGCLRAVRYKTEMCHTYEQGFPCPYGIRCQFAHGFKELRLRPRHPMHKTKLCSMFQSKGCCKYGRRCSYVHSEDQRTLESIRCNQWYTQTFESKNLKAETFNDSNFFENEVNNNKRANISPKNASENICDENYNNEDNNNNFDSNVFDYSYERDANSSVPVQAQSQLEFTQQSLQLSHSTIDRRAIVPVQHQYEGFTSTNAQSVYIPSANVSCTYYNVEGRLGQHIPMYCVSYTNNRHNIIYEYQQQLQQQHPITVTQQSSVFFNTAAYASLPHYVQQHQHFQESQNFTMHCDNRYKFFSAVPCVIGVPYNGNMYFIRPNTPLYNANVYIITQQ